MNSRQAKAKDHPSVTGAIFGVFVFIDFCHVRITKEWESDTSCNNQPIKKICCIFQLNTKSIFNLIKLILLRT